MQVEQVQVLLAAKAVPGVRAKNGWLETKNTGFPATVSIALESDQNLDRGRVNIHQYVTRVHHKCSGEL